ncbi:MAG: serine/threonine protein kinase, partial [Burkholderiales bacterium]
DTSPPLHEVPGGRPYFVMELVKGIPLTKFCDEQRLSIRERLELLMPVCQAIQHAHQKGIIHRDISPGNVLVALYDGRPVPKVIDFGIAKAIGQPLTERTLVTGFGAIIGKLEYMSPEQAEFNQLDIDTRSDIYSLGVVLYELLTGTTPLTREALQQAALDEVLRHIRETEPPKPSTRLSQTKDRLASISAQRKLVPAHMTKMLRGDLDSIAMKALEKERNRRYETANGLASDIHRHLSNEPVIARAPSNLYRFQKIVRRNKLAFAAAGAVAAVLVLGALISTWQAARATKAESDQRRLRTQAETALKQAQDAATEAKLTLAAADFSQAIGLIEQDKPSDALPYLVRNQ